MLNHNFSSYVMVSPHNSLFFRIPDYRRSNIINFKHKFTLKIIKFHNRIKSCSYNTPNRQPLIPFCKRLIIFIFLVKPKINSSTSRYMSPHFQSQNQIITFFIKFIKIGPAVTTPQ